MIEPRICACSVIPAWHLQPLGAAFSAGRVIPGAATRAGSYCLRSPGADPIYWGIRLDYQQPESGAGRLVWPRNEAINRHRGNKGIHHPASCPNFDVYADSQDNALVRRKKNTTDSNDARQALGLEAGSRIKRVLHLRPELEHLSRRVSEFIDSGNTSGVPFYEKA